MSVYFIDSSSLAKRYKKEAGSEKVDEIFSKSLSQHLISNLTVIEIQSALASKVRTQEISNHEFMLLRRRFFADINKKTLSVIGIREGFTSQEFQASPWFNLKGKHMRAQQIGMMLHELGGLNLMVTIAVFIQRQLDFQRMKSLGACWSGIGKW